MSGSDSLHAADLIIYWQSPPTDEYKVELLEGDRKPGCDWDLLHWDIIVQKWRKHELACLWLCERHAQEYGFIWRVGQHGYRLVHQNNGVPHRLF